MAGEYEPNDSRNVTGTGTTPDGRWTNQAGQTPDAAGQPQQQGMGQRQAGQRQAGQGQAGQGQDDWARQQGSGAYAESGQQRQFDDGSAQMGGGRGEEFAEQIREHMRVVDADGNEIGRVDGCGDGQIKLTRRDSADGEHHYIEMDAVEAVDGDTVRLRPDGNSLNDSGFGQGV